MASKPDFIMLVVSGVSGNNQSSAEYLALAAALRLPVFVVITKADCCDPSRLTQVVNETRALVDMSSTQLSSFRISNEDDCVSAAFRMACETVVPIFTISNVTGLVSCFSWVFILISYPLLDRCCSGCVTFGYPWNATEVRSPRSLQLLLWDRLQNWMSSADSFAATSINSYWKLNRTLFSFWGMGLPIKFTGSLVRRNKRRYFPRVYLWRDAGTISGFGIYGLGVHSFSPSVLRTLVRWISLRIFQINLGNVAWTVDASKLYHKATPLVKTPSGHDDRLLMTLPGNNWYSYQARLGNLSEYPGTVSFVLNRFLGLISSSIFLDVSKLQRAYCRHS